MAIVRELVTLVSFKSEGLGQVEAGVERLKSSLMTLGKMFGIYLAADKIFELVDGLVSAGKEINKLQAQIARLARPSDDAVRANKELFEIAQRTGVEYTHTLDLYREMANESQESKVTQDQMLGTVENIQKAFRVGRMDNEKQKEVLDSLNQGFRRGAIPLRQWAAIADEAPELVNALIEGMGGFGKVSRKTLEQMAKDGKLTADVFINALGKSLTQLDKNFAKTPLTISRAFTIVWNRFAKLSSEIWKVQGVTSKVAHYIVQSFDAVFRVIDRVIDIFGGLEKTIEVVGYAAGVAIGLKLIPLLKSGVKWATMLALRFAFAAGSIALITAGIIDLVYWMKGGDSIIGDYLGSFEDVMAFLNTKIQASPFAGPFNLLVGVLKEVNEQLDKMDISLWKILAGIFAISVAWKAFKIAKWTTDLLGLTKSPAAKAAAAAAEVVPGAGAAKPGPKGGGGFWAGALTWFRNLAPLLMTGPAGQLTGDSEPQEDQIAAAEKKRAEWNKAHPGETPSSFGWLGRLLERAMKGPEELSKNWFDDIVKGGAIAPTAPVMTPGVPGTVPPGATLNNSGNATVNQTNQITIQIDPSLNLADQIRTGITNAVGELSRQAANAMPVTEAAKG